jgi:hypothetical protein
VVQLGQQGLQENITLCNNFTGSPIDQVPALTYGHVRLNATQERLRRAPVFIQDWDRVKPDPRRDLVNTHDAYERYLRNVLTAGQKGGSIDPYANIRSCRGRGARCREIITSCKIEVSCPKRPHAVMARS